MSYIGGWGGLARGLPRATRLVPASSSCVGMLGEQAARAHHPRQPRHQPLPLGPRDAAFLAATFLTVDFLAADFMAVLAVDFLAVDFLVVVVFADAVLALVFVAVDFLAVDFLGSVIWEPVFFLSRAGSILAAPAPGANRLSCPSFHRTRYWTPRSPSRTSMISPSRGGPPTRGGLTTMRSPFLATRPPSPPALRRPREWVRGATGTAQTSAPRCTHR